MRIISVRVDNDTYTALKAMPNYSEFIREAITKGIGPRIFVLCDICCDDAAGTKIELRERGWTVKNHEVICPKH